MRLPVEPPAPVEPPGDLYEIRRKWRVAAARTVLPRTLPPFIVRHRPIEQDLPEETERAAHPAEWPPPALPPARAMIERRTYCRRVANRPVLLDTRTGHDRRASTRREDDPIFTVDEEV